MLSTPRSRAPRVSSPSGNGRPSFQPQRVTIRSEMDIVREVLHARSARGRVRAIGSAGSKNGAWRTAGTQLDMGRYDGLVSAQGRTLTVQAGMTVARLQAAAAARGLALATPGEWNGATVAGAISTGTHGGSVLHGCLATSLRTIRMITGTGEAVVLERGTEDFRHAGISLGLLGVISELTFECCEQFHLSFERCVLPVDPFLADCERMLCGHEFFAAVWFVSAGRVAISLADRTAPRAPRRRPERFDATVALLSRFDRWPGPADSLAQYALTRSAAGDSASILSPIRRRSRAVRWQRALAPHHREVEFAVPLGCAWEVLDAFAAFMRVWPRTLVRPVGLRATARDEFSLSPCSGRDVLWVSVFYRENPRFTAALAAFFDHFEARCHWGKHVVLPAAVLRRHYPRWDAFVGARSRFDPHHLFDNTFTQEMGL